MNSKNKHKRTKRPKYTPDCDDSSYSLGSDYSKRQKLSNSSESLIQSENTPLKELESEKEASDEDWVTVSERAIALECAYVNLKSTSLSRELTIADSFKHALFENKQTKEQE